MGFIRRLKTLGAILVCSAATASGSDVELLGLVAARARAGDGPPPWTAGGFGRLDAASPAGSGQIDAGLRWEPTATLLLHVHGLARSRTGGHRAGVTEAFVQYRPELTPDATLRFRAGLFFPPTSRENVSDLWSSPYTLTFSALNSWIGEEVRLLGSESAVILGRPDASQLQVAATALWGADSAGALLAWRGWAMGDRLAVTSEILPLPKIATLRDGGTFAKQRDDGTRPVDELDGRVGWQARARWSRPGASVQVAWLDNRGDRRLHRGQYAWSTSYGSAGADLRLGPVQLVAEAMLGDTGMGPRGPGVDVRFKTAYGLASVGDDPFRVSVRFDRFDVDDLDREPEPSHESGHAWTLAAFWSPRPRVRLGIEAVDLRATRPAAAHAGADPATDARRGTLELRVSF